MSPYSFKPFQPFSRHRVSHHSQLSHRRASSHFRQRARRRGISMYLFIGTFPVMMGMMGLVIDLSNIYTRRAIAQRAADAAALAGAMTSGPDDATKTITNDQEVMDEAKVYAIDNGYTDSDGSTIVTVNPRDLGRAGRVRVTVSRNERVFFTPVLEFLLGENPAYSRRVSATAVAQKVVKSNLFLGGDYGTTTGASNPSAFGPYALHSFGDPYSTLFYDDGTPNTPENTGRNQGTGFDSTSHYNPDGFTYNMTVSQDFAATNETLRVQLYDPDGYDSKDGQSLDEIHLDYPPGHPPTIPQATTKYTIYKVQDNGTLKEVPGATATYGNDQKTDAAYLKSQGQDPWVTPDGFKIDLGAQGAGEYRIRVKTLDGSSENGYNLRAGPDYDGVKTEAEWNKEFGDNGGLSPDNVKVPIVAADHLQMNFTRTAPVRVKLGYFPKSVAGKNLNVTKFDTDVGSDSINYSFEEPGQSPRMAEGTNYLDPTSDYWSRNSVPVPADFQGGYLFAEYDAGQQDTSSWSIDYSGSGPGSVKLVQ